MSEKGFDWNNPADQEDVVFPSTQGVAVYLNPLNNVVIRQEAGTLHEEDTVIVVPREQVENLILALQNVLKAD